MKLLMLARSFPPDVVDGPGRMAEGLYRAARDGHEVRLVAGFRRDRALLPPEALGVDLADRAFGRTHLALRRSARSAARKLRAEIALTTSLEVPELAIPMVAAVPGPGPDPGAGTLARVRAGVYRRQSLRLARVIVPHGPAREALTATGVDARLIEVIPAGVDVPGAGSRSEDGVLRLVHLGAIRPSEGQHVVIDAVARLHRRDKERIQLEIVGRVDDAIYLDQLKVHAYGQPVVFRTDVDDLPAHVIGADLAVVTPLVGVGYGRTALEAMAAGVALAWAEHPTLREVTRGIGYPVPSGDAVALRELLRAALADRVALHQVGAQGRAAVLAHNTWSRVWAAYASVLSSAG